MLEMKGFMAEMLVVSLERVCLAILATWETLGSLGYISRERGTRSQCKVELKALKGATKLENGATELSGRRRHMLR